MRVARPLCARSRHGDWFEASRPAGSGAASPSAGRAPRCRSRRWLSHARQIRPDFPAALTTSVIRRPARSPAAVAFGRAVLRQSALGDRTAPRHVSRSSRAFPDGRVVSVGVHGRVGRRNAPTILNALSRRQFWDGRVSTLEQQAALPITNPSRSARLASAMLFQNRRRQGLSTRFMQDRSGSR